MEEIIITGGEYGPTRVSVYSEAGWQRDLANLTLGRHWHSCSSFTHAGEKVVILINKSKNYYYRYLST